MHSTNNNLRLKNDRKLRRMEIHIRGGDMGGWAFVTQHRDGISSRWGNIENGDKTKMELMATENALRFAKNQNWNNVNLYFTNKYVVNGSTKLQQWKENNWKTTKNKSIQYQDIWETISDFQDIIEISWNLDKSTNTCSIVDDLIKNADTKTVLQFDTGCLINTS